MRTITVYYNFLLLQSGIAGISLTIIEFALGEERVRIVDCKMGIDVNWEAKKGGPVSFSYHYETLKN